MARPSLIDQLGMPDRSGDEAYFRRLMKPKVTKEQFQERARAARQQRMPPVPKAARGAAKRARKRRRKKSLEDIATSLFQKLKGGIGAVDVGTKPVSNVNELAWRPEEGQPPQPPPDQTQGVPVTGFTLPEGAVGWSAMPTAMRQAFPHVVPGAYFNPDDLNPQEKMLLRRLQMAGQQEVQMRQQEEQMRQKAAMAMGPPVP